MGGRQVPIVGSMKGLILSLGTVTGSFWVGRNGCGSIRLVEGGGLGALGVGKGLGW